MDNCLFHPKGLICISPLGDTAAVMHPMLLLNATATEVPASLQRGFRELQALCEGCAHPCWGA